MGSGLRDARLASLELPACACGRDLWPGDGDRCAVCQHQQLDGCEVCGQPVALIWDGGLCPDCKAHYCAMPACRAPTPPWEDVCAACRRSRFRKFDDTDWIYRDSTAAARAVVRPEAKLAPRDYLPREMAKRLSGFEFMPKVGITDRYGYIIDQQHVNVREAYKCGQIRLNTERYVNAIIVDLDSGMQGLLALDSMISAGRWPEYSWAQPTKSWNFHVVWTLEVPVRLGPEGSPAAQRLARDVQQFANLRLEEIGADRSYTAKLTVMPDGSAEWGRVEGTSLRDEWLPLMEPGWQGRPGVPEAVPAQGSLARREALQQAAGRALREACYSAALGDDTALSRLAAELNSRHCDPPLRERDAIAAVEYVRDQVVAGQATREFRERQRRRGKRRAAQLRGKAAERRERVSALLAEGRSQAEIAAELGVSRRTVERDIKALRSV